MDDRKEFLQSMRNLVSPGNKFVTIAIEDFERLMSIANMGARVTDDACTCTWDQYGYARDAKCVLHGNW